MSNETGTSGGMGVGGGGVGPNVGIAATIGGWAVGVTRLLSSVGEAVGESVGRMENGVNVGGMIRGVGVMISALSSPHTPVVRTACATQ